MDTDRDRLEAHLTALGERENEARAELKEAGDRSDTVRARALGDELRRIERRRAEILQAMPRVTPVGGAPRRNRGD